MGNDLRDDKGHGGLQNVPNNSQKTAGGGGTMQQNNPCLDKELMNGLQQFTPNVNNNFVKKFTNNKYGNHNTNRLNTNANNTLLAALNTKKELKANASTHQQQHTNVTFPTSEPLQLCDKQCAGGAKTKQPTLPAMTGNANQVQMQLTQENKDRIIKRNVAVNKPTTIANEVVKNINDINGNQRLLTSTTTTMAAQETARRRQLWYQHNQQKHAL